MQDTLPLQPWELPDYRPVNILPEIRPPDWWPRTMKRSSSALNPMAATYVPQAAKAARPKYFQDAASQKRYYGIKRNIGYRGRFPLSQWYDLPVERGSQMSLDLVGPSHKLATEAQKRTRHRIMMHGRGKYYSGRGGFFGGLAGLLTGQGWKAGSDFGDKVWDAIKVPATALATSKGIPLDKIMAASDTAGQLGQQLATHYGKGMYGKRRMLGQGLYKGRGAYATNHIVTDSGATASAIVPRFSQNDVTAITLSNREYVRDVYAPTAGTVFQLQSWNINPGLRDAFPWLSQIAINFEEYEIIQLIYTFKSTVADFASASGQVGQIVMATQYNPNSDAFADKEEMMLYDGGMSCKTTESLIHGIECDPTKNAGSKGKYIRAGSLPPNEDVKNYDHGKTSLAAINCPTTYAGQQLGELWVSYTVQLRKPKFASGNAYNIARDVFAMVSSWQTNSALLTQTDVLYGSRNSLGCTLQVAPAGTYIPTGGTTDALTYPTPYTFISPNIQCGLILTIPNSYSGVLAIRCRHYHHLLSVNPLAYIVSSNASTMLRFKDLPLPYTMGNAGSILGVNQSSFGHLKIETYEDSQGAGPRDEWDLHIRVLPPAAGQSNILYIGYPIPSAQICKLTFDITQMNTFLSIADNGSNDSLEFVSSITKQNAIWAQ